MEKHRRFVAGAVLAVTFCGIAGCNFWPSDETVGEISEKPAKPAQRVAEQGTVLPPGQQAASQETFATPDDAVKALVLACESKDHEDLAKIFGPAGKDLVSGDPVADQNDFDTFTDACADRAQLEDTSPDVSVLH